MRFTRRQTLALTAGGAAAACVPLDTSIGGRTEAALRLIEVDTGGSWGVAVIDSVTDRVLQHNGGTRFAMASTFKASLAAMALAAEQDGRIDLGERVTWTEADLVPYRPFAEERLATGATWRELAHAAQTISDNTAANLLLKRLGGPAAMTAFWRGSGDTTSRLDRYEPDLNRVPPQDERNTTTPLAMARTLHRLLFSDDRPPLVPERQHTLRDWMVETRTGANRVRAGLPPMWLAGDKTGNSGNWPDAPYVRGDIGFVIGPTDAPVIWAAYHRSPLGATIAADTIDAGFARIGRAIADWIRREHVIVAT